MKAAERKAAGTATEQGQQPERRQEHGGEVLEVLRTPARMWRNRARYISLLARDTALTRKVSDLADEAVHSKIGVRFGDIAAVVFTANAMTGIGVLTVPYAFQQAGWGLGVMTLLVCMLMAFITATYVIEAEAIVNALHYAKAAHGLAERLLPECKEPQNPHCEEAVQRFEGASVRGNSGSAFKIRDRIELGMIGEEVLGKTLGSKAIYLAMILFIYGSLAAFVVTVNTSLANTIKHGWKAATAEVRHVDDFYPWCLVVTFLLAFALCLGDLQKTKPFTVAVMVIRIIAMVLMLAGAFKALHREGVPLHDAMESLPAWNPEGFGTVFGNCVYLFAIHHCLPSFIAPLERQTDASRVIVAAFVGVVFLIVLLSVSGMLTYGSSLHSFYNLDFAQLSWLRGSVALFLIAYPTFAISTIPGSAITLRNTLGEALHAPAFDPERTLATSNLLLTLLVLLPPFTIAFLTRNIQGLIKCVGGYLGLTVSYILPLVLVIAGRQKLTKVTNGSSNFKWHLRSPFGNWCGYSMVLAFYVLALARQIMVS